MKCGISKGLFVFEQYIIDLCQQFVCFGNRLLTCGGSLLQDGADKVNITVTTVFDFNLEREKIARRDIENLFNDFFGKRG